MTLALAELAAGVGLVVLLARHALPAEALSAHSELGVGLARAGISFPTYAEVLFYTATRAAVELGLPLSGQAEHVAA